MKIALLSDINSSHTQKWANGLARIGHTVSIFSLSDKLPTTAYNQRCHVVVAGINAGVVVGGSAAQKLLKYAACIPRLRAFLKTSRPDIVHAHYLSSYGLLGALSGHPRLIMSAWGSDVLVFPARSALRRRFIRNVTSRAMFLTASSRFLAHALETLSCRAVEVVPFGIEPEDFAAPQQVSPFPAGSVVIGSVKTFEPTYGLDTLVDAFIAMRTDERNRHLKLVLVGDGRLRASIFKRIHDAGLGAECLLPGKVPQEDVPKWHRLIDIFVSPSVSESFGVSLVESMAAARPVVASDIPAFRELLADSRSGLLFPVGDVSALILAIQRLVNSPELRHEFGYNAQVRASSLYHFAQNVRQMEEIYLMMLRKSR